MRLISLFVVSILLVSCNYNNQSSDEQQLPIEIPNEFHLVGELTLQGGVMAAEISAYDPSNGFLFVTNNAAGNRIDVIDINNPNKPVYKDSIYLQPELESNMEVTSLAVKNNLLATAVASKNKTDPGITHIFNTDNFQHIKSIEVGSLPDMITFSPDGKYILTANEGEPNPEYNIDPTGSVSIISVDNGYKHEKVEFNSFENQLEKLTQEGFRIFAPNATFAQDIEPEYIAISKDSKFAWVTLQENNGIARIDLFSKTVVDIFGLGFKDFSMEGNQIDICDLDSQIVLKKWPIKGMYQPDAIAVFSHEDKYYLITANEGDARDYPGFSELARIADLTLDTLAFRDSELLKGCENIGRMVVTTTMGDIDNDGDYDELYAFGSRSFSVWNGLTGDLIMDSKNMLERDLIANSSLYDDNRSDDRGIEPEGVTIGYVAGRTIAFIGLERANSVLTYDLTVPKNPRFMQVLKTGIGPEGVLFVPQEQSKNGKSMLIVSSEIDGKIQIFQPATLPIN